MSIEEELECSDNSTLYWKKVENERVIEFLAGLNRDFDNLRGRIIGRKPQPTVREVFIEVHREDNRRRVRMREVDGDVVGDGGVTSHSRGGLAKTDIL